MQVQTGIDIIEVNRIQEAIEKQGKKFIERVYTKAEIEYCNKTGKMMYQHYAARFAAKEAIFKAISSKISIENEPNIHTKIEIQNKKDRKTICKLRKIKFVKCRTYGLKYISHKRICSSKLYHII